MRRFNKPAPKTEAEVQKIIQQAKALINQIDTFLDTVKKQKDQSQEADSQ